MVVKGKVMMITVSWGVLLSEANVVVLKVVWCGVVNRWPRC
jgi:hypothetical protein